MQDPSVRDSCAASVAAAPRGVISAVRSTKGRSLWRAYQKSRTSSRVTLAISGASLQVDTKPSNVTYTFRPIATSPMIDAAASIAQAYRLGVGFWF